MPRIVNFEGKTYNFPDDAKDEEVFSFLDTSATPPTATLAENLDVPGRMVAPALAKGVLNAQEVNEAEDLRVMREGGSVQQFAQDVAMAPSPVGVVGAAGKQAVNAIRGALASDEDIAQQEQEVRTLQGAGREANADIQDIMPENPSLPLRVATGVTTNLAQNAPGLAASLLTRNPAPAMAAGAALASGSASDTPLTVEPSDETFEEKTLLKTQLSQMLGTAEGVLEMLPTKYLVDRFGTEGLSRLVSQYVIREVPTELATTATQSTITKALAEPDKPIGVWIDELESDLLETALVTPLTAGIQGGAARAYGRLAGQDVKQAATVQRENAVATGDTEEAQIAQDMLDLVEEDELNDRGLEQSTNQEFIPQPTLSPEIEALVQGAELSDEALAGIAATLPKPPIAPEKANDGTSWQGVDTALGTDTQIGNTQRVRNNAENYEPNANDDIARSERIIIAGPEGTVGQTLGTVKAEPGTYAIGVPTLDRSADVIGGYQELYETLRQQFMPGSTLVLANETMPSRQNIGMTQRLPSGEYLIVPAFLRNFSADTSVGTQAAGTFNMHTKAKAFYNVFHEFGHALTVDRFLENTTPEVQSRFMTESAFGEISQETIGQLSPEQGALAQAYNDMRKAVKTMNAATFQATWMSPALAVQRKLISDVKGFPDMNAESFVRRLVSRGNPEIAQLQADIALDPTRRKELGVQIDAIQTKLMNEYLSFDEFMAEQMARYAHEKKLGQDTQLAQGEYFAGGIGYVNAEEKVRQNLLNTAIEKIQDSLRQLFIALKKGIKLENGQTFRIASHTSFDNWIESLARGSEIQIRTDITGKVEQVKPKRQLKKVPQTEAVRVMRRAITFGHLTPKEKTELYTMLRLGEVQEASERLVEMLKNRVHKQVDPGVEQDDPEWSRVRTQSQRFKAWFGDWETGTNASKVVDAKGRPLVVFHGTTLDVTSFQQTNDIGFHFGSLLAAHARMYLAPPEQVQARIELDEYRGERDAQGGDTWRARDTGMNIIPAFLNLRNPLVFGVEDQNMWKYPDALAWHLKAQGVLTNIEAANVQSFGDVRSLLQAKGFDGIQYVNAVEGGTSYVAFEPVQVKSTNSTNFDGKDTRIHAQVDTDVTTTMGLEVVTLQHVLNRYTNMGMLGRALNWTTKLQWYVMQLQQLAHIHPEFEFLGTLNNAFRQYQASKSRLQVQGEHVAQKWRGMGKEWDAKLSKALEAEAEGLVHWTKLEKVEGGWKHVVTQETLDELRKHGLTLDTPGGRKAIEVYKQSKDVVTQQLDAAMVALNMRLAQRISDQNELVQRLSAVNKKFSEIRQIPFLPRGDYGSWGFKITQYEGLQGTIVHRQMFENESDMVKTVEAARGKLLKGQKLEVFRDKLGEENRVLLALPLEYLEQAAEVLDLTEDQVDQLTEMLIPVKQDKLLVPYMRALERIGGGSTDRMRNFADFVWHNSTLVARTEVQDAVSAAKRGANLLWNQVNKAPMQESNRLALLKDINAAKTFMERTVDYTFAPPNELYKTRSAVALVYLWGGIKTALLNAVGLITTWSALSSKYGIVQGNKVFLQGHEQLLRAGMEHFDLTKMDPTLMKLYSRAIRDGFIVQSYAAHLAGAATDGSLHRLGNRSRWLRVGKFGIGTVADAGMLPFTLMEQYTRRITFLSIAQGLINEAKTRGETPDVDAIYLEATKQNDLLQNSYTLSNRPLIMRGGGIGGAALPLATIFLSFMEHMAFHGYGGYQLGNERRQEMFNLPKDKGKLTHTQYLLLMLFLLGGYEALPGAENLLDILDAIFMATVGKPARQFIREGIKDFPETGPLDDPRWWSRGLGGDVAGVDVSASLGVGRIVPGTDVLAVAPDNANELAGETAFSLGGVAGSLARWGMQLGIDLDNNVPIEESMAKFPGAIGAQFAASQWAEKGVTTKAGAQIYEPNAGEIFAKRLGFTPSGLSEEREERWAVQQSVLYWTNQRGDLQRDYNRAMDENDREAIADVRSRVESFNDRVRDPRMALRMWQMNRSYRQHRRELRQIESGQPDRNVRNLSDEIESSFGEEEQ